MIKNTKEKINGQYKYYSDESSRRVCQNVGNVENSAFGEGLYVFVDKRDKGAEGKRDACKYKPLRQLLLWRRHKREDESQRRRDAERGKFKEMRTLSDKRLCYLIFYPGFFCDMIYRCVNGIAFFCRFLRVVKRV